MTVGELIKELEKMPKDKVVEIATLSTTCGIVSRVLEYEKYVELESNED